METLFLRIVEISLSVSLIILLVAGLSHFSGKVFTARWKVWVWLIIAIRLLLPFNIELKQPVVQIKAPEVNVSLSERGNLEFMPPEMAVNEPINPVIADNEESVNSNIPVKKEVSLTWTASILWVTGIVIYIVIQSLSYLKLILELHRWAMPASEAVSRIANMEAKQLGIRQQVQVMQSSRIKVPMMKGFIKPTMLLPVRDYTENELHFICCHECVHFKHKDIWIKLVSMSATALHWFNPLVHYMNYALGLDLEKACDSSVVKNKNLEYRKSYNYTILNTIDKQGQPYPLTTAFSQKKNLKQRFMNILDMKIKRKGRISLCLLVMICVMAGGLVACDKTIGEPTIKNWTEDEVCELFEKDENNKEYEVLDCVSVSDFAYDAVGAVMYVDENHETCYVSFIDADGFTQTVGIQNIVDHGGKLVYLKEGEVEVTINNDEGEPYVYSLTYTKSAFNKVAFALIDKNMPATQSDFEDNGLEVIDYERLVFLNENNLANSGVNVISKRLDDGLVIESRSSLYIDTLVGLALTSENQGIGAELDKPFNIELSVNKYKMKFTFMSGGKVLVNDETEMYIGSQAGLDKFLAFDHAHFYTGEHIKLSDDLTFKKEDIQSVNVIRTHYTENISATIISKAALNALFKEVLRCNVTKVLEGEDVGIMKAAGGAPFVEFTFNLADGRKAVVTIKGGVVIVDTEGVIEEYLPVGSNDIFTAKPVYMQPIGEQIPEVTLNGKALDQEVVAYEYDGNTMINAVNVDTINMYDEKIDLSTGLIELRTSHEITKCTVKKVGEDAVTEVNFEEGVATYFTEDGEYVLEIVYPLENGGSMSAVAAYIVN